MLYRFVRATRRSFGLTVMWVYIGAFAVAFCFTFALPIVTLALVFIAIFGLVGVYLTELCLAASERLLARGFLRSSTCPRCQHGVPVVAAEGGIVACMTCGTRFDRSGDELDPEANAPPSAA